MDKNMKVALYGIIAWLVPFVSAFLFYSKEGELLIDVFLFKTIMIVVGSIVGAALIVKYFLSIGKNYLNEGIKIGAAWLAIGIVLDALVLLPMSGMDFGTYFAQIGARYAVLPIFTITAGYLLEKKK